MNIYYAFAGTSLILLSFCLVVAGICQTQRNYLNTGELFMMIGLILMTRGTVDNFKEYALMYSMAIGLIIVAIDIFITTQLVKERRMSNEKNGKENSSQN